MRFQSVTIITTVFLSALAAALPTSQPQDDGAAAVDGIQTPASEAGIDKPLCTEGFSACVSSFMCTAQYPQSCHCQNNIREKCALACGVGAPRPQVCDPLPEPPVETPKPPITACKCAKPKMCLMAWPASCHCEVDQRKQCAELCGQKWNDKKERARCFVGYSEALEGETPESE